MTTRRGDWWCPECKFVIFASKPRCKKCGFARPPPSTRGQWSPSQLWTPGDTDERWDRAGPYSTLKGGYFGDRLPGEPADLIYPECGCHPFSCCPQRHHGPLCRCDGCRGETYTLPEMRLSDTTT